MILSSCASTETEDEISTIVPSNSIPIEFEVDSTNDSILSYSANPEKIHLFWKDTSGQLLGNLGRLREYVHGFGDSLLFATNAGMYMDNRAPLGLFIQEGKTKRKLNTTQDAHGNFYLQPNGVFYIKKENKAGIIKSTAFEMDSAINYATQSGPMLLINGVFHSKLNKGSKNLNIRNGVGILPNGDVLFAMSKRPTNFYDFASYFKSQGCENALYLDGFVSRTYLPSQQWEQTGGFFGVMIGVIN